MAYLTYNSAVEDYPIRVWVNPYSWQEGNTPDPPSGGYFQYGTQNIIFSPGFTPAISLVASGIPTAGRYQWGILGDDGNIYSGTARGHEIIKFDPLTEITTQIQLGELQSTNGYYAKFPILGKPNFIYLLPVVEDCPESPLLKYRISTGTTTRISLVNSYNQNYLKWISACLAPNGNIYCPPYQDYRIRIINTLTDTVSYVSVYNLNDTSYKYGSIILGDDGFLYAIPAGNSNNSSRILKINPANNTWENVLLGTSANSFGSATYSNRIYSPIYTSNTFTVYPVGGFPTNYGLTGASISNIPNSYQGINLAPNGKFYSIPYSQTKVLETTSGVSSSFNGFGNLTGLYKWVGGVLAPNGNTYGIPYYSTDFLKIDVGVTNPDPILLSAYYNKF